MNSQPVTERARIWRLRYWILVVLILLAFGRDIWALGGKSLWWDESLSLHRARSPMASVLTNQIIITDTITSVATKDNHPPLYFVLLWVAVRLFGQSEFALRFLSLIFAILSVPLLYATGTRLVDEWAGLAAAALGTLSPMVLWYSQEARMYMMLAFLSLLSFYCFVRAFLEPAEPSSARRRQWWIGAYAVASICVVLTHYLGILLIAFELAVLGVLILRQVRNRRALALTVIGLLLVVLPVGIYAWSILPTDRKQPGFNYIPLFDLARDLLNSFSLGLSVDIDYWYILFVDVAFLLFLLVGFFWLVRPGAPRNWRTAGWLLAGYLLIPVAGIHLAARVRPVYMNSRHLILIAPAFYLLVAAGLTRWRRRSLGFALLGGLVMIAGTSYSTWNYFNEIAFDKDHHREWGAYLREHVRPGDVVVVEPPHIAELYEYYGDSGVPWVGLPLLNSSPEETMAVLEDLSRRYDRIWLAVSRTPAWGDRKRIPKRWLDNNAFLVDHEPIHSYGSSVFITNYLPFGPQVGRLPEDAQPLEVRYSPSLRLIGYRLVSSAQPGKQVHVELFWAVDGSAPEEASVVLRLVDDEGHSWGQSDQCPFNGFYPMKQWQAGDTLRDEHELLIQPGTPPGTYQLELMLVSRPTEEGCAGPPGTTLLPLTAPSHVNRGDRVLLGTVDVEHPETAARLDDLAIGRQHRTRFDGLELLGSDFTPAQPKPGERLDVTLYWQAREAPLPDALFRLRLKDQEGNAWQEEIIRPAGNVHPADQWQAGDRIKGKFWLRLPEDIPGGRYRLELVPEPPLQQTGLGATLRRQLASEAVGVKLGEVEVEVRPAGQATAPVTPVPPPTDLDVTHPMLATLDGKVRFLGYDLDTGAARVGETLSLTLYWQALRPMDTSYSVFTHLLGPANEVVAHKDGVPQEGAYPTTLWQPGEVIADTYRLGLAPDMLPGNYPVEIGMYLLATGVRLPILDAGGQPVPDDRILLPGVPIRPSLTPAPDIPQEVREERYSIYLPLVLNGR
jgi:4-amino-4-deoxy-L-arabinose transferase-like glycosyltransferase